MATRRPSEPTRSSKAAAPTRAKSRSTAAPTTEASAPVASSPPRAKSASPTPKRAATPESAGAAVPRTQVSPDTRRAMIAESAFLRAERRGFAPGNEEEDWCAAEREVDALLSAGSSASPPQ